MSFLAGNAAQRARAILGAQSGEFSQSSSLILTEGEIDGQRIYLLAQDARLEGGSFGAGESDAVAQWLQGVAAEPAPIIFALDSGGARMSEGLAALGGFRRLFRAAADAWLAGVPMFFVCGKTVFGGASMLASLGDMRVFFERSLFGMSGPRIVQAVAGEADFNADDRALVASVMGGAARAQRDGNALRVDDAVAVRAAISAWLTERSFTLKPSPREIGEQDGALFYRENFLVAADVGRDLSSDRSSCDAFTRLKAQLISQRQQLEREGHARLGNPQKIPAAQFPQIAIRDAWVDDGVLLGRNADGGYLYGLVGGIWADSWHAWKLANALLAQAESAPQVSATIMLDCPAHATSRALEAGMISQYFALLGLVVRYLHTCGADVALHIVGDAAGGVHVALAGGATRVIAHAQSTIRILPKIAITQVKGERAEIAASAADWLAAGVADSLG